MDISILTIIFIIVMVIILAYKKLTNKMNDGINYNRVVYCIDNVHKGEYSMRMTYFCKSIDTLHILVWVPYYNMKMVARLDKSNYYLIHSDIAEAVPEH